MTTLENILSSKFADGNMAIICGESHPVSGWGNCDWITPTVEIFKLKHDGFDYVFGEKIPGEYNYLITVSNVNEDDRVYTPHGEYNYLIGHDAVFVDFDEDDRRLMFEPVGDYPHTPFGWTEEDKQMLKDLLTII